VCRVCGGTVRGIARRAPKGRCFEDQTMPRKIDADTILNDARVTLMGVAGSPYTRKMLAVLRYRQIPYRLLIASNVAGGELTGLPVPKPSLLPTFFLPADDGTLQAVTDSTPLIRRFEASHPGRSVIPSDPALALIDALIEDYADEWLTKAMFHYRWHYQADIDKASAILATWSRPPLSDEEHARYGKLIADRQIPRLRYVGSNETTAPVIEASYERFLDAFEHHLRTHRYLLGTRPGSSDFGVFGQLTQLAHFDPTCMAVTLKRAPRVYGWVGNVEDLSGLLPEENDWFDVQALPATVTAILREIGRVYPAAMLANAQAVMNGATEVSTQIDGKPWVQQPFPYQAKCLQWLRRDHALLDAAARKRFDTAIAGTGCEALFN
jgi:glutathione S-transferase